MKTLGHVVAIAACALLCSCVEHRGQVDMPSHIEGLHVFADGVEQDHKQNTAAGFTHALPQEMHIDAWYRDDDGMLFRAHSHLRSPRPWWQRFPFDIMSDGMWPGTLTVDAKESLHFNKVERVETSYLDALAETHGYKDRASLKTPKVQP